jgi:hypothetical protein
MLRTDFHKSCGGLFNSKSSSDSLDPMQLGASLLSFNEMQVSVLKKVLGFVQKLRHVKFKLFD